MLGVQEEQVVAAAAPNNSKPSGFRRVAGPVITLPRRLYDWVLGWADTPHAIAALAILAFAEASFFPVPPDVLLIALCLGAPKSWRKLALMTTVASVLGGLAGYGIGALVWSQVAQFFYGFVPGFTAERFAAAQGYYAEYGVLIVFTAGFSPIPYKVFTIASGVMELPLATFLVASGASRGLRFFLVAMLLGLLGERVKGFIDRYFNLLALLFSVLLVGGFALLAWLL